MRRLNDERGERRARKIRERLTRVSRPAFKGLHRRKKKSAAKTARRHLTSAALGMLVFSIVFGSTWMIWQT